MRPQTRLAAGLVAGFLAWGADARARAQDGVPSVETLARSIVRVGRGPAGGGRCTGVFVGPRTVLTAGHCTVTGRQWGEGGLRDLTLWHEGRPLAVERVRLAPVSPFAAGGGIADLGNDWAVLELAGQVDPPAVALPYLGADAARRAFATEASLLKVGFDPQGRGGYVLRASAGCTVLAVAPPATSLQFRCGDGLGDGASGSPLLVEEGGRWGVVGLMSGRRTGAGPAVGIAVVPPAAALGGR